MLNRSSGRYISSAIWRPASGAAQTIAISDLSHASQPLRWRSIQIQASEKTVVELGKKLGGEVKVTSFVRFELGEGIEKKVENLADEVAKTIGA